MYRSLGLRVWALLAVCVIGSGCNRELGAPIVQPNLYMIEEVGLDSANQNTAATMDSLIAPYTAQLSEQMNRVVATVALPLVKAQPESPLGNWTADLLLAAARDLFPDREIAFAVQNYGGLRISEIGAGPLRVGKLYELMPFDNELVLVEVNGRELREFVEHVLAEGGWPVSEGLSASVVDGSVRILVDGAPLEDARVYYVAVPDYVANGGSNSAMLVDRRQIPSGRMVRDLLIEYAGKIPGPIAVRATGDRINLDGE